MRVRSAVLSLAVAAALTLVSGTQAQAADVATLTAGVPVTATILRPNVGSAVLRLYDPNGSYRYGANLNQLPTWLEFTLDADGLWKVVVDPFGASTGQATLTWANDLGPTALIPSTAVSTFIKYRGQN